MECMNYILSVTLFVFTTIRSSHQDFGSPDFLAWGDCPNVTLFKDFDSEKYSGLWFDIESVPNEYQYVKKCLIQNYIWTGDQMLVETRGLSDASSKVRQTASMEIEVENNDPAYMMVTAEDVPDSPYQIIDTDYHNYACVYSCTTFVGFKAEFTWVFGRAPVLAKEFVDRCHTKFREMDVDPSPMHKIIQGEVCPYWEKLPKMLEDSKTELFKVLGPDDLATGSSSSNTIDQMQSIVSAYESSATKTNAGTSHSDVESHQTENRAPHNMSNTYLLIILLLVLSTVLMK